MIISQNVIVRPGVENAITIAILIVSGIRCGANIPVARRAITRSVLFIIYCCCLFFPRRYILGWIIIYLYSFSISDFTLFQYIKPLYSVFSCNK
jgi:hypothetical protein